MHERRLSVLPVLFFLFWLILNERFTPEIVVIGILISILVSLLNYRFVGLSFDIEKKIWSKVILIFSYFIILVVEVFKANIQMIKLILSPTINIKPQIVYFDSPVRSELAMVALANSITLTPGTITVKLDDGKFGIHAIDAPMADGIEDSIFVHRLKNIEGGIDRV